MKLISIVTFLLLSQQICFGGSYRFVCDTCKPIPIITDTSHKNKSNQKNESTRIYSDPWHPSILSLVDGFDTLICNQYVKRIQSQYIGLEYDSYKYLPEESKQEIEDCIKINHKTISNCQYHKRAAVEEGYEIIWFEVYSRKNDDNSLDTLIKIGIITRMNIRNHLYWYYGDNYKLSKQNGRLIIIRKLNEPYNIPL